MRNLLIVAMFATACALFSAQDLSAQACRGGCNIATRAQQNPEPTPTPTNLEELAKASKAAKESKTLTPAVVESNELLASARSEKVGYDGMYDVQVDDGAPRYGNLIKQASNRKQVQVQPVGLFATVNRFENGPAVDQGARGELAALRADLARVDDKATDAEARGMSRAEVDMLVHNEVQRLLAIQPPADVNEITDEVAARLLPQLNAVINDVVKLQTKNRASNSAPRQVEIEIVPVD